MSIGGPCDLAATTYELILKMGAVRWPPNEQHPRGTERLYHTQNSGPASTGATAMVRIC